MVGWKNIGGAKLVEELEAHKVKFTGEVASHWSDLLSWVLPLLLIIAHLVHEAWPILSLDFLLTNPRNGMRGGGIWAPLLGTIYLVVMSLLIATPIGVLAAVYLNEYARDNWLTRTINLAVVNLAGVPSIVHALFGVGAFVLFAHMGRSLLAASCTVAVMTLPVIITSTREALASVPTAFREACWNLGATRWQTIRTIVLPNSISGILTGVILQVSRAAGETAPTLFTGAVFFVPTADHGWAPWFPYGLDRPFMALSMHLFTLLTQVRGVSDEIQYGTAVVLIGLVLAVNSITLGGLLENGGIHKLRRIRLDEPPTLYPLVQPAAGAGGPTPRNEARRIPPSTSRRSQSTKPD